MTDRGSARTAVKTARQQDSKTAQDSFQDSWQDSWQDRGWKAPGSIAYVCARCRSMQPRQQCVFLTFLTINCADCASLREPQNRSIGAIARWWGAARLGQGPTHNTTSTEAGMLPLRGPLARPGGWLWREHGRLEQRQAPAGAGARPGAVAAGCWPLAWGSAR